MVAENGIAERGTHDELLAKGGIYTIMKCHKVMSVTIVEIYMQGIEPDVKEKAESILSTLGIPASSAINMFYKQIILQRGLPFDKNIICRTC